MNASAAAFEKSLPSPYKCPAQTASAAARAASFSCAEYLARGRIEASAFYLECGLWSAATRRHFPTGRHVSQFQSAVMPAHSKSVSKLVTNGYGLVNIWQSRADGGLVLAGNSRKIWGFAGFWRVLGWPKIVQK